METSTARNNSDLARWIRALALGALLWSGLWAMQARPTWLSATVALAIAALALATPEVAVILAILALCIPVIAANALVGVAMAIVLFSAEHFLGRGGGTVFILAGLAFVGAFFGPAWAAAALAGYLLGASEGAVTAAMACGMIELLGILTARSAVGVVPTGGSGRAAVAFSHMPDTLLSSRWIGPAFGNVSPAGLRTVGDAFAHAQYPMALVLQVLGWGVAALAAGTLLARMPRKGLWAGLGAVSAGVAVAWCTDAFIRLVMGVGGPSASTATLASSLVVVWVFVAVREGIFAPAPAQVGGTSSDPSDVIATPQPDAAQPTPSTPTAESAPQKAQ